MESLLIIDGNNLMFQMYYGFPCAINNKKGKPIHGTIGFISYLLSEIKMIRATKVAIVFDHDSSEERKAILPQYKANRIDYSSSSSSPFTQEADIVKCLRYLEIEPIYSKECEADDTIATLALKYGRDNRVTISSFDSDFFQLLSNNVSILRPRGKSSKIIDISSFKETYGFSPEYWALYKAIMGDKGDNIKGVEGFGKKRAALVVKAMEEKKSPLFYLKERQRKKIEESEDLIRRNLSLIRLVERDLDITLFSLSFNKKRVEEGNSRILNTCGIFTGVDDDREL